MSVTKNAVVTTAEDVEDCLRHESFVRLSVPLESRQTKIYRDALILNCLAWIDILSSSSTPRRFWYHQWLRDIAMTDVVDVVGTLKLSADLLVKTRSEYGNYDTFKQYLRVSGGLCKIIAPAKELIDLWFLYKEPEIFRKLRTLFLFLTRVSIPDLSDLVIEARERYVAVDSSLPDVFTSEERDIISSWFPVLTRSALYENWSPKHGPGSTADAGNSMLRKYQHFAHDDMTKRLDMLLGGNTIIANPSKKLDRTAMVVFVPKSIDKLRTICMEPATLQWYQQGFSASISKYMRNHPYLRRRIDLEDQSKSRELAYLGSIDGKLSTIDLSDASDRVSWSLVKRWTSTSALYPILWMSRSRYAQVGDQLMEQKKYAPMGSALCFPVECIIFCSIVEASIKAMGGSTRSSIYCVYGDDIIVETRYAAEVIRRLQINGFVVNTSKSFFTRDTVNFRESCGGEFLNGVDVTPVRLPRSFKGLTRGCYSIPEPIVSLIDLCNTCYSVLPSVRRYIIWDLLKIPKDVRPLFDSTGERGIYSPEPTNYHLRKPTYTKRYQQWYLQHGALSNPSGKKGDEMFALYEHLRSTNQRLSLSDPSDRVSVTLSRQARQYWSLRKTAADIVDYPINDMGIKEKGE